jgi:hypothetical protein
MLINGLTVGWIEHNSLGKMLKLVNKKVVRILAAGARSYYCTLYSGGWRLPALR